LLLSIVVRLYKNKRNNDATQYGYINPLNIDAVASAFSDKYNE